MDGVSALIGSFLGESEAPRPAAPRRGPGEGLDTGRGQANTWPLVHVICFSKDRAFQLGEYLRSLHLFGRVGSGRLRVNVLWTASSQEREARYRRLEERWHWVRFVRESDFAAQLEEIVDGCASDFVLFGVDDAVFFRQTDLEAAARTMRDDPRVAVFHVKLSRDSTFCHPAGRAMAPPHADAFEKAADGATETFALGTGGELDWNYPWDLCGSMYRAEHVKAVLQGLPRAQYNHPNRLEVDGAQAFRAVCASHAARSGGLARAGIFAGPQVMAVVTVNRVQDVYANPIYSSGADGADELEQDIDLDPHFDTCQFNLAAFRAQVLDRVHIGEYQLERRLALSVVLPFRDPGGAFLREAAMSILEQDFECSVGDDDWELLLVDDGSSDDSPGVAADLAAKYAQVRVVSSTAHLGGGTLGRQHGAPRGRVARALNAGLAHARAPIIARMDADDLSAPTRLGKQIAALAASPPRTGALGTGALFFREHSGPPSSIFQAGAAKRAVPSARGAAAVSWNLAFWCCLVHPSTVIREGMLLHLGGFDESRLAEDYDLWLRAIEKGYALDNLPETLHALRLRATSATGARSSEEKRREQVACAVRHFRALGLLDSVPESQHAPVVARLQFGGPAPDAPRELCAGVLDALFAQRGACEQLRGDYMARRLELRATGRSSTER